MEFLVMPIVILAIVLLILVPLLKGAVSGHAAKHGSSQTAEPGYYPVVYTIDQSHVGVIERFGRYHSMVNPGLHVRLPIVDRVRCVSLLTQQSQFTFDAKTQDNVTIDLGISIQYYVNAKPTANIVDNGVYLSLYTLTDPVSQMMAYFADALRSQIPLRTLDQVFEEKESIARAIADEVGHKMLAYGYVVVTTLITNIKLPEDVRISMNRIVSTKNDMVSARNEAEAERSKTVIAAQADAEAMQKTGEGIAAQCKAIAEGLKESLDVIKSSGLDVAEANALLMFTQQIDVQAKLAENSSSNTIVLPSNFGTDASLFDQMLVAGKASVEDQELTLNIRR